MHFTKEELKDIERIKRLNLVNSLTGIKPANLIGTISKKGQSNLAIFSSVVHLGSNPALLGFVLRPGREVRRDTLENILESKYYTINHVHESFAEKAHYTSAKFQKEECEFEKVGLTKEFISDFPAPFVKESSIKLGMSLQECIPIQVNDTTLVVGEVQYLIVPDALMTESGHMDLSLVEDVGISGLNTYYRIEKITTYPYARAEELPDLS